MDWLKGLVKSTSAKKVQKTKRTSGEKRYYVKTSDKRVVTAYKNPNGTGYVYHKRTASGTRNIPANGNIYKTEKEAKEKVERLKKQSKR
jgi:hypothetical protein